MVVIPVVVFVAGFLTERADLLIGSGIPILFLAFCLYIARDTVNNYRGAREEHKLGVVVVPASGEFGNSAGDGAGTFNDLGPRLTTTHGLWREPGGSTRGSLPDSQEGRHGGRDIPRVVKTVIGVPPELVARTEGDDDG